MTGSLPPSPGRPAPLSHATRFGRAWWARWLPARTNIDRRERWRVVCGALIGILLAGFLTRVSGGWLSPELPWLIAPLGASAVLVFAVHASPMARPWAVIGGNTLSALVGIACVNGLGWLGYPEVTAALAVALAIAAMLALRCLHPPGGASALLMVLGGVSASSYALYPVLLNSAALVAVGLAYNRIVRRSAPVVGRAVTGSAVPDQVQQLDLDLEAVLARHNRILDISREDLKSLLMQTQLHAYDRKLAEVRCSDVMSRDLVTVEFGTPLQDAWALLQTRRIKALPVVDRTQRIAGIITLADFLRAADLHLYEGFDEKLRTLIRTTQSVYSSKPEVVGQIMTRQVRVASMDRHLLDLVPLFGSGGHHHIPIIGDGGRLVGIITQSDLVKVMGRVVDPAA